MTNLFIFIGPLLHYYYHIQLELSLDLAIYIFFSHKNLGQLATKWIIVYYAYSGHSWQYQGQHWQGHSQLRCHCE